MKKVYEIEIDCPMCAQKVEKHLNKQENIKSATIDYSTKRVFLDFHKEIELNDLNKIIKEVEEDSYLSPIEVKRKERIIEKDEIILMIRIAISILLGVGGFILNKTIVEAWCFYIPLYIVALAIILYDIAFDAFKSIFKDKEIFTEDLLITTASIGACLLYFLGENAFFEAIMVVVLSQIGELFEDIATRKSTNAIINAINLRNDVAHLLKNKEIIDVDSSSLNIGDLIVVRPGEIIPCDSVIYDGEGYFDTSSITGEFTPVKSNINQEVLSGYKLVDGQITLKVNKLFKDSTANKILELVQNSGEKKAKATRFVDKFAKIYTPIIFLLAFLIMVVPSLILTISGQNEIVTILGETRSVWNYFLYIGLSILLIGCPCAIVVSIPLSFFAGIGLASKNKIVVKGSNYFDKLCELENVVVDKTGTLTEGVFEVTSKQINNIDEKEFDKLVSSIESLSNHPIAKAIVNSLSVKEKYEVKDYQELVGLGLKGIINNKELIIGNKSLMEKYGVSVDEIKENSTCIYACYDSKYLGYITLGDKIKDNAISFVENMHKNNIKVTMLSGDNSNSVSLVADKLNLDNYYGNLLPNQKIEKLEEIMSNSKHSTCFVGDGINDSPSIIRSDVGVAMGQIGSDIAVDNADIIIMDDDINKLSTAIKIAKKTRRKAITNIVVALTIKFALIVLSLLGVFKNLTMAVSVFADTGLTVLLVLNSLLLFKTKNIK